MLLAARVPSHLEVAVHDAVRVEERDAVEDLVRKTETLVNLTQRTHHRFFAQRVNQALVRGKAPVLPSSV